MYAQLLLVVALCAPFSSESTSHGVRRSSTAEGSASSARIPWSIVRAEIEKSFCMEEYQLPEGQTVHAPIAGFRNLCGGAPEEADLPKAVEQALDEIRPVLMALEPESIAVAQGEGLSMEERTRRVREAYLASEEFLRLLMPHLEIALETAGLSCEGCPRPAPVAMRRVTWEVLAPYVAAHAWPDPVNTTTDEDGGPAKKQGYGMHFCAGLNGISEMQDPDPHLTRAGFVAMFHTKEAHGIASTHFRNILQTAAFDALADDDSRTAYLRRRLPEELIADHELRVAVCPTLARYVNDLHLVVEECGATDAPEGERE